MSFLTSIDLVIHLVNLFVQFEPKLEADVRDILAIVHRIRDSAVEGK